MNKTQIALTYIKKYIFWVITLITLLVVMLVGSTITNQKANYFKSRESAIEGRFSEMQRLSGQENPNAVVVAQKKEDVKNLKESILDGWAQLAEPQAQFFEKGWPEFKNQNNQIDANAGYFLDELRNAFLQQSMYDAKNVIPTDVADAYREYVNRMQLRDFMNRYKIYISRQQDVQNGGVEGGAMVGNALQELNPTSNAVPLPEEGNLTWDETNRQQMLDRFNVLYRATGSKTVNSTRKILVVQEDVWMYNLLLKAITDLNEHCEGSHDAVVKRIFQIDIAADASTLNDSADSRGGRKSGRKERSGFGNEKDQNISFNSAERVISVAQEVRTGGEELGEGEMPVTEEEEEGAGGLTDEEFIELFDYRYCDAYGGFMSAEQFMAYLKTKPEFKMLPFHVKILINQQKIPQFLINCINAELPVFVHQVSMRARDFDSIPHSLDIIPDVKVSSEDGEGMGGGSIQDSPRRNRRAERGNVGSGNAGEAEGLLENNENGAASNNPNAEIDKRKPEDVEFELWGMICLFNKPDPSKLDEVVSGDGEATEGETAEGEETEGEETEGEETEGEEAEGDETSGDEEAEAKTEDAENAKDEDSAENAENDSASEASDAPEEDAEGAEDAEPAEAKEPADKNAGQSNAEALPEAKADATEEADATEKAAAEEKADADAEEP